MNEYSYYDYLIAKTPQFSCFANSILEADAIAKEAGFNAMRMACLIGGRLMAYDTSVVCRRAKLQDFGTYTVMVDGKQVSKRQEPILEVFVDRSKFVFDFSAVSLKQALINNKRKVENVRYNPAITLVWVKTGVTTLVKSCNPDDY